MKAEILYKGSLIRTISSGQTISLHCADKALTGDIVVRAIKGEAASTLISFVFNRNGEGIYSVYLAVEGMTFAEWVDSEYNTEDLYIENDIIRDKYGWRVGAGVNDIIIPNKRYFFGYISN